MQLFLHNRVHIPDSCNQSAGWIGRIAGNTDILPAHASSYDSQRLPSDLVVLVHHQEIRRSLLRSQCLLSMLYRPFQLFHSDQDLSERSVDFCLPRVEACHSRYGLLIVKDVPASRIHFQSHILFSTRICQTYFNSVFNTLRLCLNVVLAHGLCASVALATARSIPSGVDGFTCPSSLPLAGQ